MTAVTALSESDVLERPQRRAAPQPLEKVAQATMQYKVQFLDGLDNVLCEVQADARSAKPNRAYGAIDVPIHENLGEDYRDN